MSEQCQRRSCTAPAAQMLKIVVPAKGDPDGLPAAEAVMGVVVCQAHLEDADAAQFLESGGDHIRAVLQAGSRPGVKCDFDNAFMSGIPVGSELHTQLVEENVRKTN